MEKDTSVALQNKVNEQMARNLADLIAALSAQQNRLRELKATCEDAIARLEDLEEKTKALE